MHPSHKPDPAVFERGLILVLAKWVAFMYFRKKRWYRITEIGNQIREKASMDLENFPFSKKIDLKLPQAPE